ncbi:MAG: hypothetical protein SF182_14360 [Deltaproteobacteria bacterium]|nr:hypothetical protein [Deltaproteobacteria bacterium]
MLESLEVTLVIYRRAFARGAVLAVKNWPVFGSLFAYSAILAAGAYAAIFLGLVGGLLLSLLTSACLGSGLYLVEMIVRTNKVTWEDFTRSFGVYFWDVVGVSFALWVFWFVARPIIEQVPQGPVVVLAINLVLLVLFNAVPELIYLGHYSVMALLSRSYEFVTNNWIEWFPPNLLLLGGLWLLWQLPVDGWALALAKSAVISLALYFAMVVRGLIFIELDGSTRRARAFRHKMGR